MTATLTPAAQTTSITADAMSLVLEAVRCMSRAQDSAGTRYGAYDLIDAGTAIEKALPVLRGELRARFGEVPMPLRVELSSLSRGADKAAEFGQALTSIIPSGVPSAGELAMYIDEWKRSASLLMCELEAARV